MNQLGMKVEISQRDIERERSFGGSLMLCAKAAGYDLDKELQVALGVDKAQFSRWKSDQEGILWPRLEKLMDYCGNDAPLMWALDRRGYDLSSLRRKESETERLYREEQERRMKAEQELEVLRKYVGALK